MNPTNVIWTNEDFEEYARQLEVLNEKYEGAMTIEQLRRKAANIVNQQKATV